MRVVAKTGKMGIITRSGKIGVITEACRCNPWWVYLHLLAEPGFCPWLLPLAPELTSAVGTCSPQQFVVGSLGMSVALNGKLLLGYVVGIHLGVKERQFDDVSVPLCTLRDVYYGLLFARTQL